VSRRRIGTGCCLSLVLFAMASHAQTPEEKTLAESLFRQARALLAEGATAEACLKFEESLRLDPGSGTALNLAACREASGRTATAWADYSTALELAKKSQRADRVALSKRKISELAPRVPKLTIVVIADTPGLLIRLDGIEIRAGAWGSPLPVDPGAHVIEAFAIGYQSSRVEVAAAEGTSQQLDIGALTPLASEPGAGEAPIPPPTTSQTNAPQLAAPAPPPLPDTIGGAPWATPLGIGFSVLGAIALGTGIGTGVTALRLGDEVEVECPANACSARGLSALEEGRGYADASNVTFAVAAGSAALAITFLIVGATSVSQSSSKRAQRVSPWQRTLCF